MSEAVRDRSEETTCCPECGGDVIYVADRAETVREECGPVIGDDSSGSTSRLDPYRFGPTVFRDGTVVES